MYVLKILIFLTCFLAERKPEYYKTRQVRRFCEELGKGENDQIYIL